MILNLQGSIIHFLFFKNNIYLFTYLAVLGLSSSTYYRSSAAAHIIDLQLQLVAACKLLVMACKIYFPEQGSNLGSLLWEFRVLATEPPGKSHPHTFFFTYVSLVGLLIELLYFVPLFCPYDEVGPIAWYLTLW